MPLRRKKPFSFGVLCERERALTRGEVTMNAQAKEQDRAEDELELEPEMVADLEVTELDADGVRGGLPHQGKTLSPST
jgi:hypothetical protein